MATIINKFRQWLMNFLGILGLELAAKRRYEAIENKLDEIRENNALRHNAIMDGISNIQERIGRIENMFASQHVPSRQNQVVEYDWEQVQSMVLNEMMKNPPKEEN